jgi:hypothetical protein
MNLILNSRVELGISSFIEFEFSAGVGTTCRYTLKGDLINIMLNSEELQDSIAGKVPATGAVMDELLGESSQGSLVCN